MAITDYLEEINTAAPYRLQPTYHAWGEVLEAAKETQPCCVRVRVLSMDKDNSIFDSVPVLSGYGGDGYGVYCMPEEGDAVLIAFFGGDFRCPYVTASLLKQDGKLAEEVTKDKEWKKKVKWKNGSSITFEGEKGKEKMTVAGAQKWKLSMEEEAEKLYIGDADGKNSMTVQKKDGKFIVTSEKEVRLVCGNSSLDMKENGDISLECKQLNINVTDINITAKSKAHLSGQDVSIEGSTGMKVRGKSQVQVESKGTLKVSGAMINLN